MTGGVKYTVDDAKIELRNNRPSVTEILARNNFVDPNHNENYSALLKGKTSVNDRILAIFSDGTYAVNYKKDLNDISNSLMGIVNEQIDFTSDNTTIQHTINFRNEVFYKLSEVLIDDETDTTNMSLYQRLKTMNKNYDETCRNNLNAIKTTLSTYTRYTLTETTKAHVKETIDLISEKLANETSTTSEC